MTNKPHFPVSIRHTIDTLIGISLFSITTFGAQQAFAIECILDTVNDGRVSYNTDGAVGPNFDLASDDDGGAVGSLESALPCGPNAIAADVDTTALGANTTAGSESSTAVGSTASALAEGAVALGAYSIADEAQTVSVGASGSERRIVHVGAGTGATDAVNLSQLQALEARVAELEALIDALQDFPPGPPPGIGPE
jgi:autotransporter adhesin